MRSAGVLVALAAVLLAACGSVPGRVAAESPGGGAAQAAARTTPSPTPTFNMDDMMGFYPQQTVFIADVEKISAVTLLNHFTRYTIATRGKAEVTVDGSVSSPITWLYVLDGIESSPLRLRTFDLQTGIERASRSDIGTVASPHRAMASVGDGRVLVLKADARRAWIDAYERLTLKPLGTVMEKAGCGDRLLASQARLAIVCLATGEIAVNALRGSGTSTVDTALSGLAGAAMAQDGTVWVVSANRQLGSIAFGETNLTKVPWPSAWTGTVLPDSLALVSGMGYAPGSAVATGSPDALIAQTDTDGSWLRVLATNVVAPRESLRLAGRLTGAPQFGIMALYPFAYFTSGGTVRHVEIRSGMVETMTELGQGATIAAVVDR
jgi:hypothetical protein